MNTMTVKSDLGKDTLYISPMRSPSLPMAFAIPSVFSRWTLPWANTGVADKMTPSSSPDKSLSHFIFASLDARPEMGRKMANAPVNRRRSFGRQVCIHPLSGVCAKLLTSVERERPLTVSS
jgi:hypothetical protein